MRTKHSATVNEELLKGPGGGGVNWTPSFA